MSEWKKRQKNNNDARLKKNCTKKRAYLLDVLALWLRDRERERENQHVFVRIWFKCSNKPANERSHSRLLLHYVSISTWCGMFFFLSFCLLFAITFAFISVRLSLVSHFTLLLLLFFSLLFFRFRHKRSTIIHWSICVHLLHFGSQAHAASNDTRRC